MYLVHPAPAAFNRIESACSCLDSLNCSNALLRCCSVAVGHSLNRWGPLQKRHPSAGGTYGFGTRTVVLRFPPLFRLPGVYFDCLDDGGGAGCFGATAAAGSAGTPAFLLAAAALS